MQGTPTKSSYQYVIESVLDEKCSVDLILCKINSQFALVNLDVVRHHTWPVASD